MNATRQARRLRRRGKLHTLLQRADLGSTLSHSCPIHAKLFTATNAGFMSRSNETASTSERTHISNRKARQHALSSSSRLHDTRLFGCRNKHCGRRIIARAADMERVCSSVTPDDLWKTLQPKLRYLTRDQQLLVSSTYCCRKRSSYLHLMPILCAFLMPLRL